MQIFLYTRLLPSTAKTNHQKLLTTTWSQLPQLINSVRRFYEKCLVIKDKDVNTSLLKRIKFLIIKADSNSSFINW